jgi:hypothetical protein
METVEKLRRLDGDIEDFFLLLLLPLTVDHDTPNTKTVNIRCEDILGPWVGDKEKGARDDNFSLLSMSFNLDPTHRYMLAGELGRMRSDFEMIDNDNALLLGKMKNSVVLKKHVVRKDLTDVARYKFTCHSSHHNVHHNVDTHKDTHKDTHQKVGDRGCERNEGNDNAATPSRSSNMSLRALAVASAKKGRGRRGEEGNEKDNEGGEEAKVSPKDTKVSSKVIYHDHTTLESGDSGRGQEERRLQQDADYDDCNESTGLLSFHDSMIP